MSSTESAKGQGGKSLQLWLTVLVAMLIGSTGWFAVTVMEMQKDLVRLRTQFEERTAHQEELKAQVNKQHETDLELQYRLQRLEERKP